MDGWPSVESRSCCGRASTSLNDGISDHVWTSVRQNCYVIIQELVDGVALVQYTPFCLRIRCILLSVSMKFVRKLLTIEQNQLCLEVSQCILDCIYINPDFQNTFLIGDESCLCGNDLELKI